MDKTRSHSDKLLLEVLQESDNLTAEERKSVSPRQDVGH